jgi:hypothetical protein
MTNRHRGIDIPTGQEICQWFTDYIGPADHHRMGPAGGNIQFLKEYQHPMGSTRQKAGTTQHHVSHRNRVKPIHILGWIYGGDYPVFVDMLWKGQLNKNSMNLGVLVQFINQ